MNLTVILLLPFELGPGNPTICLKGGTQIAGSGGHFPDGSAPQDSYFQALLTTVYAHLSGVFLLCFLMLELHMGLQRHCGNHYESQDLTHLYQLKTEVLKDLIWILIPNGIPNMSELWIYFNKGKELNQSTDSVAVSGKGLRRTIKRSLFHFKFS